MSHIKSKNTQVIQSCLRNREALFEKSNMIWNFLELPLPAIFCARVVVHGYMYVSNKNLLQGSSSQRQSSADDPAASAQGASTERKLSVDGMYFFAQLEKLVREQKYESHRYRLSHTSMLKTLLNTLYFLPGSVLPDDEGAVSSSSGNPNQMESMPKLVKEPDNDEDGEEGDKKRKRQMNEEQVRYSVLEILNFVVRNDETGRQRLMEPKEKAMHKMLRILMKDSIVSPRVKTLFNGLISSYGWEQFGVIFAERLFDEATSEQSPQNMTAQQKMTDPGKLLQILMDASAGEYTVMVRNTKPNFSPANRTGTVQNAPPQQPEFVEVTRTRDVSFHEFIGKFLWLLWVQLLNFFCQ